MKRTTQQELLSLNTIIFANGAYSIYIFHSVERRPINISIVKGSETWRDAVNLY